jgi:acyl-ACP thioesterase
VPAAPDDPDHQTATWLAARLPRAGRVHPGEARVRLGDARPGRRTRLDALARYLQDVAEDDAASADLDPQVGWVLRRTELHVERFPVLGEHLALQTFCSAVGARWAERTTLLAGDRGGRVEARAVWVALDLRRGTPARLDERFLAVYGPSAAGRRATLRLQLPPPEPGDRAGARPWPLRRADLDIWGHANNAVAWEAVEEVLGEHPPTPLRALLEHPQALLPDQRPALLARTRADALDVWLLDPASGQVLVAAQVAPAAAQDARRPT